MNCLPVTPAYAVSFKEFLLENRINRLILWLAFISIVIQFAIFKYFYPFPSFIHDDSFVYLETAYKNLDINSYLVGYSRFLRFFSSFTSSDTALVAFQYLFIQSSFLFFLFSLFYFCKPRKMLQVILLCFLLLNPLSLYLANFISSDGFFLALSFTWFTLLLWIIHKPSKQIIFLHAVVLFVSFTVRYNALIYPVITILAFLLSGLRLRNKVIGIGIAFLFCGLFVTYTMYKYKKLTGHWQYAPFSGWQLANNAMYAYRFVNSDNRKNVPKKFKALDNSIRIYFDSTRNIFKYPKERLLASTFYMWDRSLPLYHFMDMQFVNDSTITDFKKWSLVAPLYKDYGIYIIKQYPTYFTKYFLWPNANKYYAPPIEYLEMYNAGIDSTVPLSREWFGYSTVSSKFKDYKINILNFYPILSGIMNLVFFCSLIGYFLLKGFLLHKIFHKTILLSSTFLLLNAGFSIFSTAAALRFLAFPILVMSTFALLLVDYLCKIAVGREPTQIFNKQANLSLKLQAED
jgi:hypothetical protein